MSDERGLAERTKANEPTAITDAERVIADPAGKDATPDETATRENTLDEETAGDGVAFFEGGDGRESARDDIERSG